MTKSELVEKIAAARPDVPYKAVEQIVAAIFERIEAALRRGERVELRGFGRFTVRTRKACETKNPRTGRIVRVPKRRTVAFAVGKELKDRINREATIHRPFDVLDPDPQRAAG